MEKGGMSYQIPADQFCADEWFWQCGGKAWVLTLRCLSALAELSSC